MAESPSSWNFVLAMIMIIIMLAFLSPTEAAGDCQGATVAKARSTAQDALVAVQRATKIAETLPKEGGKLGSAVSSCLDMFGTATHYLTKSVLVALNGTSLSPPAKKDVRAWVSGINVNVGGCQREFEEVGIPQPSDLKKSNDDASTKTNLLVGIVTCL